MNNSKISTRNTCRRIFSMANAVTAYRAVWIILFFGFLSGISELAIISVSITLTSIDNQNVFYSFLQNYMSRNSVLLVLILIISFFSFLRIFSFKKVISYCHHIGSLLASRLIRTRLTDAYFFDTKIIDNSAFTTTIVNHLQAYVSLLQNISSAVSSLISVLAIFALISFQSMDYFVVSLASIALVYLFISKISSSQLKLVSSKIATSQKRIHTCVSESLSLDKESYISNRSSYFIDNVSHQFGFLMESLSKSSFISGSPRLFIEAILFVVLTVIIFVGTTSSSTNNSAQILIIMIAAIRLIPYAQSIYSALTSIRIFGTSVAILYDFFVSSATDLGSYNSFDYLKTNSPNASSKIVQISYTKASSLCDFPVIAQFKLPASFSTCGTIKNTELIQFNVCNSDIILISGPSGVGKSTLIESLVGLNTKINCTFSLGGSDNWRSCTSLKNSMLSVEYLNQHSSFVSSTIYDNIFMGSEQIDMGLLAHLMQEFNLILNYKELDSFLELSIGESTKYSLSGGELKRLSLIRSLVRKPDILFCDEITSGVDILNEEKMMNAIKYCCKSVFFITHSSNIVNNYSTKILNLRS